MTDPSHTPTPPRPTPADADTAPDAAPVASATPDDAALRQMLYDVRLQVGHAVVGQDGAITGLLIALLADGHVLLEGVPGVAKTLLVRAFSRALGLDTKRIQFTPDLMPGDVSGSLIYDARTAKFEFREGPIFTNIVLADEINRTPPKTQSALLEAMQEHQVTADGVTRRLPDPFLVAATQNPIEHEGTYPLPEAQLDRFLLKLVVDIPDRDAELQVLRRHADGFDPQALQTVAVVADVQRLQAAQHAAASVAVTDEVLGYLVDLARATRESPSVQLGVSPRASTALLATAKAWAWLGGYPAITPDHIQTMLVPTWRHRIRLHPDAMLEGVSVDAVLTAVLQQTRVPL